MDRSRYPANWEQISLDARARAGQRCEWPECRAPNGAWICRSHEDLEVWDEVGGPEHVLLGCRKPIRVVLTVAHLDHDPQNNAPENLQALCQLHHLRLDADQHARNAAATRARRRREREDAAGQGRMFGG